MVRGGSLEMLRAFTREADGPDTSCQSLVSSGKNRRTRIEP